MKDEQKTRLIIARHGATFEPNEASRRIGLKTDIPLSATGETQAIALGNHLKKQGLVPTAVYASHLQRTVQTAALACEAMNISRPIHEYDWFNEIDYGVDENQTDDVVLERIGQAALDAWEEHAIPPSGWDVSPVDIIEKWRLFALDVTRQYAGQTVLVVTSNGIARFAPKLTENPEFAKSRKIKLSVGCYGECTFSSTQKGWNITAWNVKP